MTLGAVAARPGPLAEVVSVCDLPTRRALGDHEVLVRMISAAVNPSDEITVSGAYGSRTRFPLVPGFEGVGEVVRTGRLVPPSALGTRVLPIGSPGTWQELRTVEHPWCVPVPESLDDTSACFAYVNPLTAVLLVERYTSAPVRDVVVTAATSTVAGHLAELLALRGIRAVGLHRRHPGWTDSRAAPWGALVSTQDGSWADQVRAATGGRGVDLVLDCVGGTLGDRLVPMLRPGGVLVLYGLLSGVPLAVRALEPQEGRHVEMFRLRDTVHAVPRPALPALFAPVFEHLEAGRLRTEVTRRVTLSDLPDAFRAGLRADAGAVEVLTAS